MAKKNNKVSFAILLSGCMLLSACSGRDSNANNGITVTTSLSDKEVLVGDIPCEFPLVKEPVTLNFMTIGYEDYSSDDVFVWNQYEKMTGIDVKWTTVTKEKRDEVISTALTNQSDLDLIMRSRFGSELLTQYGDSGYILDLNKDGMLEKNAPNCWVYLKSHPDALASVMNPDGTIYSLPQVNSGAELCVSRKLFINKEWLENVGMEAPTTTEEFYQLLKAFKEQDANGNGDPDDEIPLCSQDWLSLQEAMNGAFGLANRGVHNQVVDYDEEANHVRLIAATDDYKALLQYFNRLYTEGLMDPNIFTMNMEQWLNYVNGDRVGAYLNTNLATMPADKVDNWVAVGEALEGPGGDKLWTAIRANFHSTGAAIIPATCENPELVLKWLDYFWTDEGTLFYHMGIENETFVVKEDGSYDYMPSMYEQMKTQNQSFDDVVAEISPYPGGGNPTVEIAPYFRGGEMAKVPAEAAQKLYEYGPKEYWPNFTFTTDENKRLDIIQADINKYSTASRNDFIIGVKSFDEWEDYTKELKQLGQDELLDIYQAAVDRYEALMVARGTN